MKFTVKKLTEILDKEKKLIDENFLIDPNSKTNITIALQNFAVEIKKVLESDGKSEAHKEIKKALKRLRERN